MREITKITARKTRQAILERCNIAFHLDAFQSDCIMLTFDDGPHPVYTPQVLNILDAHGAKGVFFVIGDAAEKEPELVRQIYLRGHVLANHTYTHLNECRGGTFSFRRCLKEVMQCSQIVRWITGMETSLFRPPRGEVNLRNVAAAWSSDHKVVNWSLQGGEWGCRAKETADTIACYLMDRVRPRDIILLHDNNEKVLPVLDRLLPHVRERGLGFATAVQGSPVSRTSATTGSPRLAPTARLPRVSRP